MTAATRHQAVAEIFRVRRGQGAEIAAAAVLRRQVFCEEQGVFSGSDADDIDAVAIPLVAVVGTPCRVIGTVRIHELEPGVWWGSRLAVDTTFRTGAVGAGLVRVAVGTALTRGCRRFGAHVQADHESFFRRLQWLPREQVTLHGRQHLLMEADLAAFEPLQSLDGPLKHSMACGTGRIAA